jgi:hypothetical protein
MTIKPVLFAVVVCWVSLPAEESVVARIPLGKTHSVQEFLKDGCDIASVAPSVSVDVVIPESKYRALRSAGVAARIVQTETAMQNNLAPAPDIPGYRTYESMLTELRKIETDHPAICKLYDIGNSQGKNYFAQGKTAYGAYNHDIWALKVSKNVGTDEDEPAILYCGEHHAREPGTLETAMAVLNRIVSGYGTDSAITKNVDTRAIWFVPLVNPDGHKVVISQTNAMWRKNLRDNNNNSQFDASDGVDLNRNYGYQYGGAGSSTSISNESYRGPNAWSEPEVVAMKGIIDTQRFVAGITYHAYSEFVLYPYAYSTSVKAPDDAALCTLAVAMARTIPRFNTSGTYDAKVWSAMYPASGIIDDYAYAMYGTFLYTVEMGVEFVPSGANAAKIATDNIPASQVLLKRLSYAALNGHAYVQTGTGRRPLVGQVYVKEVDDTAASRTAYRAPLKTNAKFGAYWRLLLPGSYTVTFRPDSTRYAPQTFNNVRIKNSDTTLLDFVYSITGVLHNGEAPADKGNLLAYRASSSKISFVLPPSDRDRVLTLQSLGGKTIGRFFVRHTNRQTILQWDARSAPAGVYCARLSRDRGQPAATATVVVGR